MELKYYLDTKFTFSYLALVNQLLTMSKILAVAIEIKKLYQLKTVVN